MFRKSIYIYILAILCSCNNSSEVKEDKQLSEIINQDSLYTDSTVNDVKKQEQDTQSLSPYTKITQKTDIKVLSENKVLDTTSTFHKSYKERCDGWNLTKEDILNILLFSTEINGQEFHYYYDILPCHYSGKIIINGKPVSYIINAGSSTTLIFKDKTVYLGYTKNNYKKYFLLKPGID